jgi:hypothetical protein
LWWTPRYSAWNDVRKPSAAFTAGLLLPSNVTNDSHMATLWIVHVLKLHRITSVTEQSLYPGMATFFQTAALRASRCSAALQILKSSALRASALRACWRCSAALHRCSAALQC